MPDLSPAALIAELSRFARGLGERVGLVRAVNAAGGEEAVLCHPCEGRADRLALDYGRAELPEALLRACVHEPLKAGDTALVGREKAREQLSRGLGAWRDQRPAMIALVGPQGCGVTTLLRQLQAELLPGETLTYHALAGRPACARDALVECASLFGLEDAPLELEQLADRINALQPRLIVLDNGHFLACRIMGANEIIRTLGALMVATQERHQWIVGCRDEAWRRLVYTHKVDRFFAEVIELGPFNAEELGTLIGARFERAGFAIAPADGARAEAAEAEVPDRPPALPAIRLAQLHALSGGLPAAALAHVLRSLEKVVPEAEGEGDEGGEGVNSEAVRGEAVADAAPAWRLADFVPFDYAALKTLDRLESITLAEIVVHGALTAAEHRSLLRLPQQDSQMLLHRLHALGFLETVARPGGDPRYQLVPTHVAAVVARLHNANFLY